MGEEGAWGKGEGSRGEEMRLGRRNGERGWIGRVEIQ